MVRRVTTVAAAGVLCLCAMSASGCNQTPRATRPIIEPTWSYHDGSAPEPAPALPGATAKSPPRRPLLESLLTYVPGTPFNN